MSYTLGEAAKATGKDRATISRAIKNGKVSAAKNAHGQWEIDPAELHRVYPSAATAPQARATGDAPTRNGPATDAQQVQIEGLRAELEQVRSERDDLRRRLDEETTERREVYRQLTAVLTDQRAQPEPRPEPPRLAPQEARGGASWFSRWLRIPRT